MTDLSCLVPFSSRSQGAVKRSKLEKAEPTISYETFVEDLDPGDSFTTSLIEILVKVRVHLTSQIAVGRSSTRSVRRSSASAGNDTQSRTSVSSPIALQKACTFWPLLNASIETEAVCVV